MRKKIEKEIHSFLFPPKKIYIAKIYKKQIKKTSQLFPKDKKSFLVLEL